MTYHNPNEFPYIKWGGVTEIPIGIMSVKDAILLIGDGECSDEPLKDLSVYQECADCLYKIPRIEMGNKVTGLFPMGEDIGFSVLRGLTGIIHEWNGAIITGDYDTGKFTAGYGQEYDKLTGLYSLPYSPCDTLDSTTAEYSTEDTEETLLNESVRVAELHFHGVWWERAGKVYAGIPVYPKTFLPGTGHFYKFPLTTETVVYDLLLLRQPRK